MWYHISYNSIILFMLILSNLMVTIIKNILLLVKKVHSILINFMYCIFSKEFVNLVSGVSRILSFVITKSSITSSFQVQSFKYSSF